jgi:hypothetical protein
MDELEDELNELGSIDENELDEDEPINGLPVEVDICERYQELMRDDMIRVAMSGVVVSDGRISPSKTRQKIKAWLTEIKYRPFEQTQMRILTFLNSVWFVGCDNLSPEFWWIHKNLILKLVYISCVAEACNLQQYGQEADKHSLPRSTLYIYDYIVSLDDESFADLETEFKGLLKTHDELVQVFVKSFDEAPRGRSKTVDAKPHKTKEKTRKHKA